MFMLYENRKPIQMANLFKQKFCGNHLMKIQAITIFFFQGKFLVENHHLTYYNTIQKHSYEYKFSYIIIFALLFKFLNCKYLRIEFPK